MKEILKMIKNMDKVKLFIRINNNMKVYGRMIKWMAMGYLSIEIMIYLKETINRVKKMVLVC